MKYIFVKTHTHTQYLELYQIDQKVRTCKFYFY